MLEVGGVKEQIEKRIEKGMNMKERERRLRRVSARRERRSNVGRR